MTACSRRLVSVKDGCVEPYDEHMQKDKNQASSARILVRTRTSGTSIVSRVIGWGEKMGEVVELHCLEISVT